MFWFGAGIKKCISRCLCIDIQTGLLTFVTDTTDITHFMLHVGIHTFILTFVTTTMDTTYFELCMDIRNILLTFSYHHKCFSPELYITSHKIKFWLETRNFFFYIYIFFLYVAQFVYTVGLTETRHNIINESRREIILFLMDVICNTILRLSMT